MLGLMQDRPLLISQMIDFAARYYPDVEIVSRTVEGPIHRYGYRDAAKRSRQLAAVLHTINPRLAPEHVSYIANHAEDQLIFVDLNLLPIVEGVFGTLKTVKHI